MFQQFREGQRVRGRNGEIAVIRNGVPVPESQAPVGPQPMIQGPPREPTPRYADEATRSQNEAAASIYDPEIARANAAKAAAEAERARIEADRAARGEQRGDEERQRRGNIEALTNHLMATENFYRQNIQGGAPQPIWGHLPVEDHVRFNRMGQQLRDVGQAAFRVPGVGSQSDREYAGMLDSYVPTATAQDSSNEQTFEYIRNRVDEAREALGMAPAPWNQPEQMDRSARAGVNPILRQSELGNGETRQEVDPVRREAAQRLGEMLASGVPDNEIQAFIRGARLDGPGSNVNELLRYRRTPEFRRWRQANPGQAYPVDPITFTREVPQEGITRELSEASNSQGGAYFSQAANALLGNRLDDVVGGLGGNQQQAQLGLQGLRDEYPGSSLLGDISGQMLASGGAARVAGRIAPAALNSPLLATAGRRALAGDLAYGAYSGSGDGGAEGAAYGALLNAGGGQAARALTRGAGRAVRGVADPVVQRMTERGVPRGIL